MSASSCLGRHNTSPLVKMWGNLMIQDTETALCESQTLSKCAASYCYNSTILQILLFSTQISSLPNPWFISPLCIFNADSHGDQVEITGNANTSGKPFICIICFHIADVSSHSSRQRPSKIEAIDFPTANLSHQKYTVSKIPRKSLNRGSETCTREFTCHEIGNFASRDGPTMGSNL